MGADTTTPKPSDEDMTRTETSPPRSSPNEHGLCRHDDPEAWFAKHKVHVARAVRICFNCPAQPACARNALDRGETDGVWAGVRLPGRQEWEGLEDARDRLEMIADWQLNSREHQRRMVFADSMNAIAANRAAQHRLATVNAPKAVKYSA